MKFMKKCYKCNVEVEKATVIKDGIRLKCMRCPKCGEEYFTSSELMKYDILSGKRKMIRKFGVLGQSAILRIPEQVVRNFKIRIGDYAYFEERQEGILIKPFSASKFRK